MVEVLVVAALGISAVLLNAHAARVADRASDRRLRLEQRWSAMIAANREVA